MAMTITAIRFRNGRELQTVMYDGQEIISYTPDEKQWWITGFDPYEQNVNANDLTAVYTVSFTDESMYQSFYGKYGKEGNSADSRWSFDEESMTATFTF